MRALKALVIDNGIEGLNGLYRSDERVSYEMVEVEKDFDPDLTTCDLLIAPNGTDHIALYRIRRKVRDFLDRGGTLFCFDGWFTDWVPGNRWVMDNTKKSIEARYRIKDDPYGLSRRFSVGDLNFSHGISGWWACGYIEAAPRASVLLEDTWGRPLVVIDDTTTKGLMVLTASGPAADVSYATTDDEKAYRAMGDLYQSFITLAQERLARRERA